MFITNISSNGSITDQQMLYNKTSVKVTLPVRDKQQVYELDQFGKFTDDSFVLTDFF